MILWTNEMLEELKTANLKEFCEKHNMSLPTARNKKKDIEESTKCKVKEVLKEVKASKLEIIPSVILDIDKLIKEGYNFYIANCNNEIKRMENIILDLEHSLEATDLPDNEVVKIGRAIAECRRVRRTYKNEKQFLDSNKQECEHFIKFVKNLKEFSSGVEHYVYKPRVLKDILGDKIQTNQISISSDVIDRLLALEKFQVKQQRINKRNKGELVDIDLLKPNYQNLFRKLDTETQQAIIKDCENIYSGVDIPQIKEYIVINQILPAQLYKLGYFLKGEKHD